MEVQDFLNNQSPLAILKQWIADGSKELKEPLAVVLSTVNNSNQPSSRVVLAKEIRTDGAMTGVVFYTNYQSQKGKEIGGNPKCGLNFFWDKLSRQVRIEAQIQPLSAAESDAYWNSRPRASQISQWVSRQSEVIESRTELEKRAAEAEIRFAGQPIPRPSHWGGYIAIPTRMEFWIGSPVRLHDRFVFTLAQGGQWLGQRLSP